MTKQALHADDRLKERTSLSPEVLVRLREGLKKAHLPRGTHHVRLGPHGYAVLKDTGKRHVVATVLSRHMKPPGADVSMRVVTYQSVMSPKEKTAGVEAQGRAQQRAADIRRLKRKLRPGDILLTAPRREVRGVVERLFRPISQMIQGTEYGHSAIYVGNGKVVDARIGLGVKERSLSGMSRTHRILALAPEVSESTRKKAVEFAKKSVGAAYSVSDLLAAPLPFRRRRARVGEKALAKRVHESGICSGLVAYAYSRLKFSNSSRDLTRPSEILRSNRLKVVGRLGRKGEKYPR